MVFFFYVVTFALFFFIIRGLASVILSAVYGEAYKSLPCESQKDWACRCASSVHCLVVVPWAVYVLFSQSGPTFNYHTITAFSLPSTTVCAFSAGYFLFDVIEEAINRRPAFMVHGATSLLVYVAAVMPFPFSHWHAMFFLLFEVSTPFYNYRQILLYQGRKSERVFQRVMDMFMVTFIFFRICLGIPVSVHWWGQLLRFAQKDQQQTPMISIVYLGLANVVLNVLNVFWMYGGLKKYVQQTRERNISLGKLS